MTQTSSISYKKMISLPNEEAITQPHPSAYILGSVVTLLSAAGYIAPFFFAFPLAASVQIISLGVLTAVSYGIINDQIACRQCIQYFTVGHTDRHRRILATEDPTLNGIAWGIAATWVLGLLAGVLMAATARMTRFVAVTALRLTPFAMVAVLLTCSIAHLCSIAHQAILEKQDQVDINKKFERHIYTIVAPEPGVYQESLLNIPEDKRAAYLAVGTRNGIGYIGMIASAILLIIGIFLS